MVATSKGYRPPPRLLDAFLCVVHETAACPVRDSVDSALSRLGFHGGHQRQGECQRYPASFDADEFTAPHPKSLLVPCISYSSCSNSRPTPPPPLEKEGASGGVTSRERDCSGDTAVASPPYRRTPPPLERKGASGGVVCQGRDSTAEDTAVVPDPSSSKPHREEEEGGEEADDDSRAGGGAASGSVSPAAPSRGFRIVRPCHVAPGVRGSVFVRGDSGRGDGGGGNGEGLGRSSGEQQQRRGQRQAGGVDASTEADEVIACCRRALLMRMSYGGMACDQALLKGACLAWGERCGHYHPPRADASAVPHSRGAPVGAGGCSDALQASPPLPLLLSPAPPRYTAPPGVKGTPPFGYAHKSFASSLVATTAMAEKRERAAGGGGGGWAAFLAAAHAGTGMPAALRSRLLGHVWAPPVVVCGGGTVAAAVAGAREIAGAGREEAGEGGGSGRGDAAGDDAGRSGEKEEQGAASSLPMAVVPLGGDGGGAAGDGVGIVGRRAGDAPSMVAAATGVTPKGAPSAVTTAAAVAAGAVVSRSPIDRHLGPIVRETDAILSGVDFHCSGVLDDLLRSTAVAARVGKAIQRTASSAAEASAAAAASGGIRTGNGFAAIGGEAQEESTAGLGGAGGRGGGYENTRSEPLLGVRQAAREAMWACSGGLNARRLRVAVAGTEDGGMVLSPEGGKVASVNAAVWAALSADVLRWAGRFVRGRLAPGAVSAAQE